MIEFWDNLFFPRTLFTPAGNITYFFACNSLTTGCELWKTDGTEAGTVIVKDIWPGKGSSYPGKIKSLIETDIGSDLAVSVNADCMANITLDGSASSDPDGDPLTYTWTWSGGSATGVSPTIQLPLGAFTITLIVNDGTIDSPPDTFKIDVIDATPPTPDNLSLLEIRGEGEVTVTETPTATDNCAGTVLGITTNPLTYSTPGTYTITWSYDDGYGNIATQDQIIVVDSAAIPGDLDDNGVIDRNDVYIIKANLNQPASTCPQCDIDGDGTITVLDARKVIMLCTCQRCLCP